jgi:uncharacterized protein
MDDGIDLPAVAVALGRRLRSAGVPSTPERASHFARAAALVRPATRERLYWTARLTFVSSKGQLPAFDRVFAAVFGGLGGIDAHRGDPNAPPSPGTEPGTRPPAPRSRSTAPSGVAPRPFAGAGELGRDPPSDAPERDAVAALASSEERLSDKDFAELDAEELEALRTLMSRLALAPPSRRSRRARRGRHGERLDLRATLRRSRRSGGDPIHLVRRRRRLRPRPLVVLCDISGSMEPYARAFLQFLHGAVGGAGAEAFVFATRLTRLTRALSGNQPQLAFERAATAAPDWSSGTRIGESLREFNTRYGQRGMARGAVVVILSDGWERDDPAVVGREMARLRRLAHRIVWVNPRKASPGFAPLAGGMAAALPHCDIMLSGHSLAAMHAVADAIADERA